MDSGAGPLVSVVVINWNGAGFLEECLQSIQRQTWPYRELIVVDNGSTDDSLPILRHWEQAHGARVTWLPENTGFGHANNLAFREARGEWVALLNNDAAADPAWLERLLAQGDRHTRTGMLGGKILLYDRRGVIDKAGHLIYGDGLNRGRGTGEDDRGQFDREEEILWPDGCAALYHRDLLASTGGFDESFFAYGDDADLGLRARLQGWRAWYVPGAVVYHRHSATAGRYSPLKAMLVERNRLLLALKNFPATLLCLNPFYTVARYAWQAAGALNDRGAAGQFVREHGRWRLLATLAWAYGSAGKRLFGVLRERYRIHHRQVLSDREVRALLRRYRIGLRELTWRD